MADTDWNAFPDSTPAPGDKLIAQRGAGGVNLDVSDFAVKDGVTPGSRLNVDYGFTAFGVGGLPGLFQTYIASAPSGRRYWRMGGDVAGNWVVQVLNDAYTQAFTYLTVGGNPGAGAYFCTGYDNGFNLGLPNLRWATVYAVTGTINTSDEREKRWRGVASDTELDAARAIIGELGFFQWKDAIDAKGDEARYHFGPRAQRVWGIMAEHGLIDPIGADGRPGRTPYAFLCFDEWPDEPAVAASMDNDGNPVPGKPARAAGNRYGIRSDQLALFLVAAMGRRLAALEAAA